MAKTFCGCCEANQAITGTQWPGLGVNGDGEASGPTAAHESGTKVIWRSAGAFTRMYMRIIGNTINAASTLTLLFGEEGASTVGNLTQTIGSGSGATEVQDTTNSDAVTDGQKVQYRWNTAGAGTANLAGFSVQHVPTTGDAYQWNTGKKDSLSLASTTRYINIYGTIEDTNAETANQTELRSAGTWTNLCVQQFTTLRTTATTVRSRKETANGNQTVTMAATPADDTFYEDTTNNDSVASGNVINYSAATGTGTQALEWTPWSSKFDPTTAVYEYGCSGVQSISAGTTEFLPFAGGATNSSTTENNTKTLSQFAMTVSLMRCFWRTYSIDTGTVVRLRIEGGNGNSVNTISGINWTEDTVNTDAIAVDKDLNYSVVPAAGGTTGEIRNVLVTATEDAGGGWSGLMGARPNSLVLEM